MTYAYKQGWKFAAEGKDLTDNIYPALSANFYEFENGFIDYVMTNDCVMSA